MLESLVDERVIRARGQGAPTRHSRDYGEEAQRRDRIRGAAQALVIQVLQSTSRHFSPMGPEKAARFGIKRFE